MNKIFEFMLDLLFPPKCMFCRKILQESEKQLDLCVCESCLNLCSEKKPAKKKLEGSICTAPFYYYGEVKEAIRRYKFDSMSGYANGFSKFMADCIRDDISYCHDIITWVPLSDKRFKERGYDQARLLSDGVAKFLGSISVPTLVKIKHNKSQTATADSDQRQENVKGVYKVLDRNLVLGKRVVLIDDVCTTGSTMAEAVKVLLSSGSKKVMCLSAAVTKLE